MNDENDQLEAAPNAGGEERAPPQQRRQPERAIAQELRQPPNQPPEIPEGRRLENFEAWLARNAILDGSDDDDRANDTMDRREEIIRIREERKYQEDLHSRFFSETEAEAEEREQKRRLLEAWRSLELDLKAEDGSVIVAPLSPMAESCDTVFVVALSWHRGYFSSSTSVGSSSDENKPSLSLDDHRPSAILQFVDLVLGRTQVSDLPSDLVVDCCRIAHYLQNAVVLDEIVAILQNSIDTANCYSLSSLADELNLPSLLERSMAHMMESLGRVTDDEQVSEYLTPELQDRIGAIRTAIQSSIHSQRGRLYFSSLEEYLAIFAERVQYYRERLAQAREEQQQLLAEDQARQAEAGRFVTLHLFSTSKCYKDAQAKIDRQEARLRTLEIAYTEQKKLFASGRTNGGSGDNDRSGDSAKRQRTVG